MVVTHATKQCLDFTNSEEMVLTRGLAGYWAKGLAFLCLEFRTGTVDLFL
jgi:hypothetical protein